MWYCGLSVKGRARLQQPQQPASSGAHASCRNQTCSLRQAHLVCSKVDVAGVEDHIVICIAVALAKELPRGEAWGAAADSQVVAAGCSGRQRACKLPGAVHNACSPSCSMKAPFSMAWRAQIGPRSREQESRARSSPRVSRVCGSLPDVHIRCVPAHRSTSPFEAANDDDHFRQVPQ